MPNPIETTTIDGIPLTTIQTAAEEYIEGYVRGYNQAQIAFALIGGGLALVGASVTFTLVKRYARNKLTIVNNSSESPKSE